MRALRLSSESCRLSECDRAIVDCVKYRYAPPLSYQVVLALLERAKVQGLSGLVAESMLASGSSLPDDATALARQSRLSSLARHLAMLDDAERLSSALSSADIPHAFFKGPVISALHHVEPTSRAYLDLDVLVDPLDLEGALAALEVAGFRLETRNWPLYVALVPAELSLTNAAGTLVDLHWHVVMKRELRQARALRTSDLLARRRIVEVNGVRLPTLDATDTLVHLCVHGADAGADRLLWLFDVHCAVLAEPPDWVEVVRRSHEGRVSGQVALMLGRASRTFETPVPEDIKRQLGQRLWTTIDAVLVLIAEPGSAYPAGSLRRTFARATRERPSEGTAEVVRRGIAWLRSGGALVPRRARPFLDGDDPRSGFFDGGGLLADYLAAVRAEGQSGA